MYTKKKNRLDTIRMNHLVYVQFNARLMNKKKNSNELETLLASDASNAQSWIAEGCDDDENDDEIVNDMLPPKKCFRNAQVEIRECEENDFVSDDMKDVLDEDIDIELESDKELDESSIMEIVNIY